MSSTKIPWFVAEHTEALAVWLLTSRDDVRIRREHKYDDGVDLLVELTTGEALSTRLFVAQVRGTTSADPNEWAQVGRQLFRASGSSVYLPVVVFAVNVRTNQAQYAWLAEPLADAKGATLRFHEEGEFATLSREAVSEIVDRVKAWYDVLPKQLIPA